MPFFSYRARTSTGELAQGVLESGDSGAAAAQLLTLSLTPVEITVAGTPAGSGEGSLHRLFQQKITRLDLMLFSRQMYTLLKAGVPIMRSLAGLQESMTSKPFAAVVKDIRDSLDAGRELSVSIARQPKVFSPFYVSIVRVGEMTGQLEEVFLSMFHHLEFEKFMRDQIKSALRYPSFVLATMAAAIIVINLFVIPAFAKVYKGFHAELPWMTQMLIGFSDFMVRSWPLLLLLFLGAIYAFQRWTHSADGKPQWDELKLRIPIAGKIILKATLARFARSFALACRSGVPVVQGLTVVAQTVDNDFIAGKIEKMREGVERGESLLRTARAAGVFTPVVLQMVAVGEESGSIDELMQEIGDLYQRDVEYEMKTLAAQIEPVLIMCIAGLVLMLALGVFLPIWDLGKAVIK